MNKRICERREKDQKCSEKRYTTRNEGAVTKNRKKKKKEEERKKKAATDSSGERRGTRGEGGRGEGVRGAACGEFWRNGATCQGRRGGGGNFLRVTNNRANSTDPRGAQSPR